MPVPSFYEFFAGGGMARAGLGSNWRCLFANDFDFNKGAAYQRNWRSSEELSISDVRTVNASSVPGQADLAWASFPCQDLSLAGGGAGLKGERSGTFYPFWRIISDLIADGRGPKIVCLENVTGTLTSHSGADFTAICESFSKANYRFGAIVVNAEMFVPHSRQRLFVLGVRSDIDIKASFLAPCPLDPFHTSTLRKAVERMPIEIRDKFLWWNLPSPKRRSQTFSDLIETQPSSVDWHSREETDRLLAMMSPVNLAKVDAAKRARRRIVGTVYKRTRHDQDGLKVQRAEVRFDDIAGCLRTPAGGSSRQLIIVVEGDTIRSRLISTREAARLMGLDDSYKLPRKYNEAYHLLGDGVVVPVVRHLAQYLLEPLLGLEVGDIQPGQLEFAWTM